MDTVPQMANINTEDVNYVIISTLLLLFTFPQMQIQKPHRIVFWENRSLCKWM